MDKQRFTATVIAGREFIRMRDAAIDVEIAFHELLDTIQDHREDDYQTFSRIRHDFLRITDDNGDIKDDLFASGNTSMGTILRIALKNNLDFFTCDIDDLYKCYCEYNTRNEAR